MASKRNRNFASILYPESAPENWREILADFKIPAFISPLHDADIDPQNQPKKPHFHVVIMFDGVKTLEQAQEVFGAIGALTYVEVVQTIRGYARYLCHLDNPEKAQYSVDNVTALYGADYAGVIGLVIDKYKAIGEIIDFCREHDIDSYADILEYARYNEFGWFRILCDSGTLVVKEYLKSCSWRNSRPVPCRQSAIESD